MGIHGLRPFPTRVLADALVGAKQIFVLERTDAPLSGEPPLTREVRAALGRIDTAPPCRPVIYGVGGLALRLQDVIALCAQNPGPTADPVFLGVAFDDDAAPQPKREVMLDALRRAYPDVSRLGIRASQDLAPPAGEGTVIIAVRRHADGAQLARSAGGLLYRLQGGRVRSRPATDWPGVDTQRTDWLVCGDDAMLDPGEDLRPDVTLDVARRHVTLHRDNARFPVPVEEFQAVDEALLATRRIRP